MSMVPGSGDPDDAGVVPLPMTVVGTAVVFLSAVIGSSAVVAVRLAGGDTSWTRIWITLGVVGFGFALIAWDKLTDYFESTRPGEGPDDEAGAGVGSTVEEFGGYGGGR